MAEPPHSRTAVLVATIGLAGTLGAALIVANSGENATTTTANTSSPSVTTTLGPTTTSTAVDLTTTTDPEDVVVFKPWFDDTGLLTVEAPADWAYRGTPASIGDIQVGPALTVAVDIVLFGSGWGSPGVYLFASRTLLDQHLTPETYLNTLSNYQPCDQVIRGPYLDQKYSGVIDDFYGCGPHGVRAFQLAAVVTDAPDYLIVVQFKAPDASDSSLRDRVFATFDYTGDFAWEPTP